MRDLKILDGKLKKLKPRPLFSCIEEKESEKLCTIITNAIIGTAAREFPHFDKHQKLQHWPWQHFKPTIIGSIFNSICRPIIALCGVWLCGLAAFVLFGWPLG